MESLLNLSNEDTENTGEEDNKYGEEEVSIELEAKQRGSTRESYKDEEYEL